MKLNLTTENLPIENEGVVNGRLRVKGDDLNKRIIYAYGVGHVLNDLTCTCWFSFLLYYLTDIIKLSKMRAGLIMLSGQVADAIATPVVGILSDNCNTRIGKRTPFYLFGTVVVVISFFLIFQKCRFCYDENGDVNETLELIYYITLPCLFNVGWAAVQISHMSIVPSLSINRKSKEYMVRVRTSFTFYSQMTFLLLSFIVFYFIKNKYDQYSFLTILCTGIGIVFTLVYLYFVNEVSLSKNIGTYYTDLKNRLSKMGEEESASLSLSEKPIAKKSGESVMREMLDINTEASKVSVENASKQENVKLETKETNYQTIEDESDKKQEEVYETQLPSPSHAKLDQADSETFNQHESHIQEHYGITYWLKKPDFYKHIIIYMLVRLSINCSSSTLPYYLESILGVSKTKSGGTPIEISILFILHTFGCILGSVWILPFLEKKYSNRQVMLLFSLGFVFSGCFPILFLSPSFRSPIYFLSFIFGIGFSIGLSTASNLVNDVVGSKGNHGAFVYGAYSFTDKLSCGIALYFFISFLKDETHFFKFLLPLLPIVGISFSICILGFKKKTQLKEDLENSKSIIENSKISFLSTK